MFIKTEDYTVWRKSFNGEDRYYVEFRGDEPSQQHEIGVDVFALYVGEFYRTLEKQRNERRRHIHNGSLDDAAVLSELESRAAADEDNRVSLYSVEAALETCTEVQQRRFKLHYFEGYAFSEIAKIENCDPSVIRRSVLATLKKIKNIF